MHVLLAGIHLSKVFGWIIATPSGFETVRQAFEMVAVLAETLNFALMLTLAISFTDNFEYFEDLQKLQTNTDLLTFRRWLTIEALMFIVTVFGNILVVLLRTCFRDPLQLDLDSHRTEAYNQIDYLRSESTQLIVNVMTICLFPVTVFIFLARMP